jgi:hypothetical protein
MDVLPLECVVSPRFNLHGHAKLWEWIIINHLFIVKCEFFYSIN